MRSTMDKIREMADTNTIVGQPITTPDGVTLIPISRVSMGFGCGGADYAARPSPRTSAAAAARA
ncbi:MAG: GerW family sporulation protein [Dysosmobacter welbionis]